MVKHINIYNVNACIISGIYVVFKNEKWNKGKYPKEVNENENNMERQGNMICRSTITDDMDEIKNR